MIFLPPFIKIFPSIRHPRTSHSDTAAADKDFCDLAILMFSTIEHFVHKDKIFNNMKSFQ